MKSKSLSLSLCLSLSLSLSDRQEHEEDVYTAKCKHFPLSFFKSNIKQKAFSVQLIHKATSPF